MKITHSPVDILAFGAHPDDIEFGCGGILAKAVTAGYRVALCDLTAGECASHGSTKERRREALAAATLLNAERICLDLDDCSLYDTSKHRERLVEVIRLTRPHLILAPCWEGTRHHPDHLATGLLARTACRLARFPSLLPKLPPHRVQGILHYLSLVEGKADFISDISSEVETWKQLICCHESQLQTLPYLDWCLKNAAYWGMQIGTQYGQPLIKSNPICIEDPMAIARGTVEL